MANATLREHYVENDKYNNVMLSATKHLDSMANATLRERYVSPLATLREQNDTILMSC